MSRFNRKDILAGLAALIIGTVVCVISLDFRLGTAARMGPGFVPMILGIILVVSGVIAILVGTRSLESVPQLRWRPMIAVTVALITFALTVERLGFVPASVLLIFLTGLSEDPPKWKALLILSVVLTPAAYLLFIVLLGIPAPAFAWSL